MSNECLTTASLRASSIACAAKSRVFVHTLGSTITLVRSQVKSLTLSCGKKSLYQRGIIKRLTSHTGGIAWNVLAKHPHTAHVVTPCSPQTSCATTYHSTTFLIIAPRPSSSSPSSSRLRGLVSFTIAVLRACVAWSPRGIQVRSDLTRTGGGGQVCKISRKTAAKAQLQHDRA